MHSAYFLTYLLTLVYRPYPCDGVWLQARGFIWCGLTINFLAKYQVYNAEKTVI